MRNIQICLNISEEDLELAFTFLYGFVFVANPDKETRRVAKRIFDQVEPHMKRKLGLEYPAFMQMIKSKTRDVQDVDAIPAKKTPVPA